MTTDFACVWIARQLGTCRRNRADRNRALQQVLDNLLHYRPVAIAASVAGETIEADVLAVMMKMDARQLLPSLHHLFRIGVLYQIGNGISAAYAFADQALQQEAYHELSASQRRVLHRRAADAMSERDPARTLDRAKQIAAHYEAAGAISQSFKWWRTTAERAMLEASPAAALAHIEHALRHCVFPAAVVSARDELIALALKGPLQAQLCGSGSKEVSDVYARCLEITANMADADRAVIFDVMWGLNAWILVHGRIKTARELGERLLETARAAGNDTQLMLAIRLDGLGKLLAGEIAPAIGDFEAVGQLYQPEAHAELRFRYASDQAAVALAHKALAQAIAGDAAKSERSSDAALDRANALRHPHTNAHVMCVLAARAQILQRRDRAGPLARGAREVARDYCFPYWEAWAEMILGWHEGHRDPVTGAGRIDRAIEAYRRTGAGQALPYAQLLRASVALEAGDCSTAIRASDAALALSDAHGVALFQSEILRAKALALGRSHQGEALLINAVSTARRQGAGLFESRAAAALAQSPA
jgi:tetratricopeptide (TPR) repeat protein